MVKSGALAPEGIVTPQLACHENNPSATIWPFRKSAFFLFLPNESLSVDTT
jgi:hypothetical protein